MSVVERALAGQRLFVEVLAGDRPWVPAVEVALQEGIAALAFHASELDLLPQALGFFGRRARVGVWGAVTPGQVADAVARGAHFVTSPVALPGLSDAAGDVPFLPGGLTPSELVAAAGDVVQVVPADAMPMSYARGLAALLGGKQFVPCGRIERFQVDLWFASGAAAVGVSWASLLGEGAVDLGALRDRCRSYVGAVPAA